MSININTLSIFFNAIQQGNVQEVRNIIEKNNLQVNTIQDDNTMLNHNMIFYAAENTIDDER